MAECVERTWDTDGPPMWRHECACQHGRIRGIQMFIDDALPESRREVIKARARDRAHAELRCEDDHPALMEARRG